MADTAPAPTDALAALRGEIDTLDDALHDLLMRRADVVARLAGSRAKGNTIPLRPGREALILRRLLGRNQGPLAQAALVRLWREIFAQSTAAQGNFSVAAHVRAPEELRLAQEHFGALTPVRSHPTPARALAAVTNGEASVAVLPLPREADTPELVWWPRLDAPKLQVVARLPFWAGQADPGPEALVVAPVPPDATGQDRSLLMLELARDAGRAALSQALTAAGLAPRSLLFQRDADLTHALAEVDGALVAKDPRLAGLPVLRALPLGFYAVPIRGD